MSLEENATSTWDSPPHLQSPEQPSTRFINLKTTYWNRGYAISLLGIIGLSLASIQWHVFYRFVYYMKQKYEQDNIVYYNHEYIMTYNLYGYFISLIPGGILATVYPAHNILGISVAITSMGHLLVILSINYLNDIAQCILHFCVGTSMGMVDASYYRVWTYWVPLNKQSIRHVPIVLYMLIFEGGYVHDTIDKLHDPHSSYPLTIFIGAIGFVWYALWLYVINGNYSFRSLWNPDFILFGGSNNSRYSFDTYGVSLIRSIVSDIPWKSIFTSKPFLAILLLYACDARLSQSYYPEDYHLSLIMGDYTIILLLLFVVLVEFVPEITVSTSNVRKFWSCSYFGLAGTIFFLESIFGQDTVKTNIVCQYFTNEMHYLYNFGFYINVLDIAPKYASILGSLLLGIHYIFDYFWAIFRLLPPVEETIMLAITSFAAAVLYAIYASAEIQPWAEEPEEENQQNMVEDDNII